MTVVVICKFSQYFSTHIFYFHTNAYCKSNWRTATEYKIILNNVTMCQTKIGPFYENNLASWLASAEQMCEILKHLLLIKKI